MTHLFVEQVLDVEMVRLAIFLSAVISLLVYERYGISTGGTIVAGYLALFVPQPTHLLVTLGMGYLTYLVVHKVLRPRFMLWGRKLFETEMVVALTLQSLWFVALMLLTPITAQTALLYGIGFLLPGIMAHDMGRQGVEKTLNVILPSTLAIFALLLVIRSLRDMLGLAGPLVTTDALRLAFPFEWLIVAVNLSVLVNIVLYHRLFPGGQQVSEAVRTGGFVSAAYLALLVGRPLDLLVIVVCSLLTYLVVVHVLMRHFILFGRVKLGTMFISAFVITTLVEAIIGVTRPDLASFSAFNAIIPTIVALLANDAQRQGVGRTALGTGLSTAGVYATMIFLVAAFGVTGL
jgi:poly-gamma-glutamate biosynthesis protein PgsC/CapC